MNSLRATIPLIFLIVQTGIHPTRLDAQTWAHQSSGTYAHFAGVYFLDAQRGWICGSAGKVLTTQNGGADWVLLTGVPGVDYSDVYFVNENIGWVTGLGGIIIRTIDGGLSWTIQSIGTTGWMNCLTFIDAQTGWAAGLNGVVLKTTNGGINWNPQVSGTASSLEDMSFVNATTGWMVTDAGEVLRTVDGGGTWSRQTLNPPAALKSVDFLNASYGWIAGSGGAILKTVDGGASWTNQTSGTTQVLHDIAFVTSETGWAAGNAGVILFTTNGGGTWSNQFSSTLENLRSLWFIDADHGYAVGLNNTILEYAAQHAVPIQLVSFTSTVLNNGRVRLNWRTASEVQNYGFEVERAPSPSVTFSTIPGSFIPGGGTTNEPHDYTYTDNAPIAGRSYYRLKHIDLDGSVNYTEPIAAEILTSANRREGPTAYALKQNYPNPFNPTTQIAFSIPVGGFVSLKVHDMLGREVATLVHEELPEGDFIRTFTGEKLASGVYYYRLTAGQFSESKKFVLSK